MSQLMGKEDTGLWSRQRIPERYFKLTVQTAEPAALVISVPALESASGTTMSFTVFPRTRPLGMDSAICFLWFCVWTVAAYSNSQSFQTTNFICASSERDRDMLVCKLFGTS